MQYIIHDIFKLPLADRLLLIEQVICNIVQTENEERIKSIISNSISQINKQ